MKVLEYTNALINEIAGYMVQHLPIQSRFPISKSKTKVKIKKEKDYKR